MGDLLFVAVVIAFFAVTLAYVKGCERIVGPDTPPVGRCRRGPRRRRRHHRPRGRTRLGDNGLMGADNVIGLVLAVLLTAYLVAALVVPEKF
jgi:K+-transporting ATPase KdpF subunit